MFSEPEASLIETLTFMLLLHRSGARIIKLIRP